MAYDLCGVCDLHTRIEYFSGYLRVGICAMGVWGIAYMAIQHRTTALGHRVAISIVVARLIVYARAKSLNSNIGAPRDLFVRIKVHGVPTNCMRFLLLLLLLSYRYLDKCVCMVTNYGHKSILRSSLRLHNVAL